jgi:ribosomal protein S18 acetylase RimI-like enzyme
MSKKAGKDAKKEAKKAAAAAELALQQQRKAKQQSAMFAEGSSSGSCSSSLSSRAPKNWLLDFAPFCRFDRNGLDVELFFSSPEHPSWTPEVAAFVFELTKDNMQAVYDQAGPAWAWKDSKKRSELQDPEGRYILARQRSSSSSSSTEASSEGSGASAAAPAAASGALVGLVAFRFFIDEEFDVLYVYELQLAAAAQRKGLGKHFMQMCELIARKAGFHL